MSSRLGSVALLTVLSAGLVALAFACSDSDEPGSAFDAGGGGPDTGSSGSGGSSGQFPDAGGDGEAFDSGLPEGTLRAIIRDFKLYDASAPDGSLNPDFENPPPDSDRPDGAASPYYGNYTEATPAYYADATYPLDIVLPDLGADGLPQYNTASSFKGVAGRTATTHGKTWFDQWYRDVPNVNVQRQVLVELTKVGNVYSYDSAVSGVPLSPTNPTKQFFPIDDGTPYATDDAGFGNQGLPHDYSFTVELHTRFTYKGTESFTFSGDDDVFVFINKKLAINIGGIHSALTKEVKLPVEAARLGLVVGQEYPLDFFQAERHVEQSNLRIETTIDLKPGVIR